MKSNLSTCKTEKQATNITINDAKDLSQETQSSGQGEIETFQEELSNLS
jgi:hypothetical protein